MFKEKFGEEYKGVPIYYVLQEFDEERRERPWGTADAVCCIRGVIDCPFVFCNGDDIYGSKTFEKLFEHLQESDECATIGYELKDAIPEKGSVHRAIFDIDERNYVKKLEEVFNIKMNELDEKGLKEEDLSSMNIFALHPEVIEMLYSELLTFKLNNLGDKKIEFLIPTELSRLVESKRIKMKIYSTPDKWFGVTNPEDEGIVREMLKKEEEV